jgi:hypothetical protein
MNGYIYQDLASKDITAGKQHFMGDKIPLLRRIGSHIKAFGLGWGGVLFREREGEEIVLICRK